LDHADLDAKFIYMGEGERHKTLGTVERFYTELTRCGINRECGLIAFGGGVIGDTAGFTAATYLRGIEFIQMPTTLLAQIDASIGGKVGVDLPQGKNLVGAIYRPRAVVIDPELLTTLARREIQSGLFELLKYGFITSPKLFKQIEKLPMNTALPSDDLDQAIATAVRKKLAVVRIDERETGERRILNFGHTIGHGLEAAGDYRLLSHGQAVGWGMIAAVELARRRQVIGPELAKRMVSAVENMAFLPSLRRLSPRRVMAAIDQDKKIGRRGFRFVLPTAIGRVRVEEGFPRDEIRWAVNQLGVGKS
jgi:3-dehydroquinate synthase